MGKKCLKTGFIGLSLFGLFFSFTGVGFAQEVKQISMGTATVGGIMYNLGAPIAQCVNKALPDVNITAEVTQGSVENLRLIGQKKMELATITPSVGGSARKGVAMFAKSGAVDFRVVTRLLPNGNVWGVLKSSDVKSIPELKGKRVGVGPASGGLGDVAQAQLAANGLNYKEDIKPYFLGAGEMSEAVKDGTIEGAIFTMETAQQTAMTHPLRVLSWDEGILKKFLAEHPTYGKYIYPVGTFKGVDYPVLTMDNGIQLICPVDLDDELVYKIVKAIAENLDCMGQVYAPAKALSIELMAEPLGNPYHPGAIRYFKEKGLMK